MKSFFLCALLIATPALSDLTTDMINDHLDRLDNDIILIQQTLSQKEERPSIKSEATVPLELYTQIEEQDKVISGLTAKVEELTHAQEELKEKLQTLQSDIEIRFEEKNKSEKFPEKKETPKLTDKEAYDKAYNFMLQTKYAEAEKEFQKFLADYPDSTLVGNANYWLGESYYARGQYELAAGIFSDGLTKYEKSTKAADNLLKLGMTMGKLEKKDEACGFFKLLPDKFPKADKKLTQKAIEESKKLSCP